MSPEYNLKKKHLAFISKNFRWIERDGTVVLVDTRSTKICDPHDINAKINIYEDRVNGWFLDIGRLLIPNVYSEFVILQIAISYIEGNQQLRDGKISTGHSETCFAKAVQRIFAPDGVILEDAKILYREVRCGLFHQGMTSKRVLLSSAFSKAMMHMDGGIYINPCLFFNRVVNDFHKYIHELKLPSNDDSRKKFEKIFYFGQEELPKE